MPMPILSVVERPVPALEVGDEGPILDGISSLDIEAESRSGDTL
jgi:hypothetical protein